MPTKNNVVLTQECHSPKSLWGIFRILSCCTDSIKVVILNRSLYLWAAPRSVFIRGLVTYRIQDLQRLLFWLRKGVRGRFQIKFGMTPLFNKGAFTIIELLVVILIIGILAAIALPQYQSVIDRATFTKIDTISRHIAQQLEWYYIQYGEYPADWQQVDFNLPQCIIHHASISCENIKFVDRSLEIVRAKDLWGFEATTGYFRNWYFFIHKTGNEYPGRWQCYGLPGASNRGYKLCNHLCGASTCYHN